LLDEALDAGKDMVVLDVADLTFIDVRSVRMCAEAASALRDRGGTLVVKNSTRMIRRMFDILAEPDAVKLA
jgi:anti-anti-sigma factor